MALMRKKKHGFPNPCSPQKNEYLVNTYRHLTGAIGTLSQTKFEIILVIFGWSAMHTHNQICRFLFQLQSNSFIKPLSPDPEKLSSSTHRVFTTLSTRQFGTSISGSRAIRMGPFFNFSQDLPMEF